MQPRTLPTTFHALLAKAPKHPITLAPVSIQKKEKLQ